MKIAKRAGFVLLTLLFPACLPSLPEPPEPGPSTEAGGPLPGAASDTVTPISDDCFRRHLLDAISLNERRLPVYREWSDGRSVEISRALIRMERLALIAAWQVDAEARPYHRAGIPIVCSEYVSMSLTPPLPERPGPGLTGPYRSPPPPDSMIAAIREVYGAGGFEGVVDATDRLMELLGRPEQNCMVRHVLESLGRVASLAPVHLRSARSAGLPSTRPLSELMLRLHLEVLDESVALDRRAAPLQAIGIPILCADLPPIEWAGTDPEWRTADRSPRGDRSPRNR